MYFNTAFYVFHAFGLQFWFCWAKKGAHFYGEAGVVRHFFIALQGLNKVENNDSL